MEEPLKSFLKERRRAADRIFMLGLVSGLLIAAPALVVACTSTPPVVAKAETDLCKARADWLLAVAVDPALAPAPGSVRARLEAAEDAFCAAESAASK